MSDIKIAYRPLHGGESKAYVNESTGIGEDKYTDEVVHVRWDDDLAIWIECEVYRG